MLRIAVLVSGGGTNLQAIIDSVNEGIITNTSIELVISNKKDAFALERAGKAGIDAKCISPKDYASREEFADAMTLSGTKVEGYTKLDDGLEKSFVAAE